MCICLYCIWLNMYIYIYIYHFTSLDITWPGIIMLHVFQCSLSGSPSWLPMWPGPQLVVQKSTPEAFAHECVPSITTFCISELPSKSSNTEKKHILCSQNHLETPCWLLIHPFTWHYEILAKKFLSQIWAMQRSNGAGGEGGKGGSLPSDTRNSTEPWNIHWGESPSAQNHSNIICSSPFMLEFPRVTAPGNQPVPHVPTSSLTRRTPQNMVQHPTGYSPIPNLFSFILRKQEQQTLAVFHIVSHFRCLCSHMIVWDTARC